MSEVTRVLSAIEQGNPHAADVLGISRAAADRYWAYAKAWLYCVLSGEAKPDHG